MAKTPPRNSWRIRLDPRSRHYGIAPTSNKALRSYSWSCPIYLDQGEQGACTGFATAHCDCARPFKAQRTDGDANAIYARAKVLDEWPGEDYEGSSVLGAVKAATERGWFSSYMWAFSEPELAQGVAFSGPAVLGIPWFSGMDEPNPYGVIRATGEIVGGHAILCNGFNATSGLYRLHNSWGRGWGAKGDAFITRRDMAILIKEGSEMCFPSLKVIPKPA